MDAGKGFIRSAKRVAPPWTKAAVLGGLREYAMATHRWRPLPDFLVVGGKRCGTTTLYWHLTQHPCVAPLFPRAQRIKGIHFFDWHFGRGLGWYRSHFPTGAYRAHLQRAHGSPARAGEASSTYLFHPRAPGRASLVVPAARLIVVIRNPVDRAWSHYRARVRHGVEPLSFEEALEAEPSRLEGELERMLDDQEYRSDPLEQQAYVSLGLYLDPLRAWMGLFPPEQVLVIRSEDLAARTTDTYRAVLRFLGLADWAPTGFRALNVAPVDEEMQPATRARLGSLFAPRNAELEDFLGFDLGWDRI